MVKSVIHDQIPTINGENVVQIGPVDYEIILLECLFKKKEINASRACSRRGMHAARTK